MRSQALFFSFAQIPDKSNHVAYNEWHQLDHRPENLALDGVLHGERWVRTPECFATSVAHEQLAGTHYVNSYWFREPWRESFVAWQQLAERSYQWGRRPEIEFATRPMMGLFSTVSGHAAPRVLVSPDALIHRPHRAVQLRLVQFTETHAPATHAYLHDSGVRRVPELVATDGVAGVWTFSSISTTLDPSWQAVPGSATFDPSGVDAGLIRAELTFIDGDPEQTAAAMAQVPDDSVEAAGREIFRSLLMPITAWQWNWFDGTA